MKANLLMICLLRSSAAALATPPRPRGVGGVLGGSSVGGGGSVVGRSAGTPPHQPSRTNASRATTDAERNRRPALASGRIAFRLARRTDVPGIQKCNLATLPENYNANFYVNHMRKWPELTLVAEHVPEGCRTAEEDLGGRDDGDLAITPLSEYIRGRRRGDDDDGPRKEIVGYVLGKVEERPVDPQRRIFPPASRAVPPYDEGDTLSRYLGGGSGSGSSRVRFPTRRRGRSPPTEPIGHVTSLAVHHHARRLGVASSLIRQLHYHLQECYGVESIGLHVRISNKAAVGLYCDDGYDVADIIPRYYGDGEDAYFMRKDFDNAIASKPSPPPPLPLQQQQQQQQQQRQWRRGEKEREEWLNRDATSGGNFFDNRKSMRETLAEDELAWVTNGDDGDVRIEAASSPPGNATSSSPSLFKRSFRTFFNGGGEETTQRQRQQGRIQSPPWEMGPEGLRLPRYREVTGRSPAPSPSEPSAAAAAAPIGGMSLRDLVATNDGGGEDDGVVGSYEGGKEGGALSPLDDARVASGSV